VDDPDARPASTGSETITIYTIGHSDHSSAELVALLRQHAIGLLVDVRSSPYSRYAPQANRETLARTLTRAGITYTWMGDRLGGKPEGVVPDYDQLRTSTAFRDGIQRLVQEAARLRTCIMCAEGDYRQCHRSRLITPALLHQHVGVRHILPDGSLVADETLPTQLRLF
jgi:uncharacterized protein (DUF488 family)